MSTVKGEDGWVEVEAEPSVPKGWKKKVYCMSGRLNPKWVQYYDLEENRYNSLSSVEAHKRTMENNQTLQANLANPRPVKSAKKMPSMSDITSEKIVSSCDICNIELNSVEELQAHIKERHSDDDDDEAGKYFSDDDNSPILDSSPDDPNLKCVECNTQYKKPNQFENHMKKRHGGIKPNTIVKDNIETTNKLTEDKSDAWDEFEDDMEDYEEEELEDEFLEDIAPKTVETHKLEPNKILTNGNDKIINPSGKTENSWYASVHQIIQRFRLQDYQTPPKIGSMEKYRDEARFVEYIAPLLRSVNLRAKTSTLFILAKAKWFELMQSKGVTPVNGSLTNLRKPRKIVVNTL